MRESFSLYPNSCITSSTGRRMLKPSLILHCISPRMKKVISRVKSEACGPLEMAVSSAWGNQRGPCKTVCPPTHRSRVEPQLGTSPLGQASQCLPLLTIEEQNMEGALSIYLEVPLAVSTRSSVSGSLGGG